MKLSDKELLEAHLEIVEKRIAAARDALRAVIPTSRVEVNKLYLHEMDAHINSAAFALADAEKLRRKEQ